MGARTYRLEVRGELGDVVGSTFRGMTATYRDGNTVLVGAVRDQAELTGLLQRCSDLGLTLLSVNAVEHEPAS